MKNILIILITFYISLTVHGQSSNWVCMPQELNSSVSSICSYKGKLIVSGWFTKIGNLSADGIAAWDGNNWESLGQGRRFGINAFLPTDSVLYAGGLGDSINGISVNGIGKWDGVNWTPLGSGLKVGREILALASYQGQIIAAGYFDSISGVKANRIAAWNGSSWRAIDSGLSVQSIKSLCVYHNELYALGIIDSVNHQKSKGIAKWNGTQWIALGNGLSNYYFDLVVWKDKLVIGDDNNFTTGNFSKFMIWDGNAFSVLSNDSLFSLSAYKLFVHKGILIAGGESYQNQNAMFYWDEAVNKWKFLGSGIIGNGVYNFVTSICEFDSNLFCAGVFNNQVGAFCNYLAKWDGILGISNEKDDTNVMFQIAPNPTSENITIQLSNFHHGTFSLYSMHGSKLCEFKIEESGNKVIDLSTFSPDTYLAILSNELGIFRKRIVKY